MKSKLTDNELSYEIIGAAIEVHRHLVPGLLESSEDSKMINLEKSHSTKENFFLFSFTFASSHLCVR